MELPPPPRSLVRTIFLLRQALRRAGDAVLPSDVLVTEAALAFAQTRLLGAVAEHGVADALAAGPATAEELARRLDLDADALHRVLRALGVYGFVSLDRRGRFRLRRAGQALRSDHPRSHRAWVRYVNLASTQDAWAAVGETLRTGQPSFNAVHGHNVWEHFAEHPEEERLFAESMQKVTEGDAPAIARGYPWPEGGTVCDVAGGVGTLLAAILAQRPGLRGVLVDAPGVLAEADGFLRAAGVRERVELRDGDMFERVDAQADVYVLKDVFHDWDDARCAQVLGTVRATMPPGSRVVLVEVLQERNAIDPIASLVDVHMLTQCDGGRQRSVEELHALLRGAGLRPGAIHRTAVPALVEGLAP
jgi:DNA-binding transcriptional ArsR family regulator